MKMNSVEGVDFGETRAQHELKNNAIGNKELLVTTYGSYTLRHNINTSFKVESNGDQNQNLNHKRTKPKDNIYRDIIKIMMV